jgi:hypothetical protein
MGNPGRFALLGPGNAHWSRKQMFQNATQFAFRDVEDRGRLSPVQRDHRFLLVR